jgi:hypothetical protein
METPYNKGRQFEKDLADEFGLKLVPGSGSVWHSKLDLEGNNFRWSLKYTDGSTFPLNYTILREAYEVCYGPGGDGASPIWAIRIPMGDFILMRKEDFKDMQSGDITLIEEDRPQVAARKKRASQPELLRED